MQWDQGEGFAHAYSAQGGQGGIDFRHAGHEHQDVTLFPGIDNAFGGIGGLLGHGPIIGLAQKPHGDGEALAFGDEDRAGGG